MVICGICKEEYAESHIEFHLLGVHGVANIPNEISPTPAVGQKPGNVVVYLEKLPNAFDFKKGYTIPKIRGGHYRLNDSRLKYCGLKK